MEKLLFKVTDGVNEVFTSGTILIEEANNNPTTWDRIKEQINKTESQEEEENKEKDTTLKVKDIKLHKAKDNADFCSPNRPISFLIFDNFSLFTPLDSCSYKNMINCLNRRFVIFITYTDDNIKLGRSLVNHLNINFRMS